MDSCSVKIPTVISEIDNCPTCQPCPYLAGHSTRKSQQHPCPYLLARAVGSTWRGPEEVNQLTIAAAVSDHGLYHDLGFPMYWHLNVTCSLTVHVQHTVGLALVPCINLTSPLRRSQTMVQSSRSMFRSQRIPIQRTGHFFRLCISCRGTSNTCNQSGTPNPQRGWKAIPHHTG